MHDTAPVMNPTAIRHYDEALAAGLSPASAARWVAYLDMKTARGETPITLAEAVEQKRAALAAA